MAHHRTRRRPDDPRLSHLHRRAARARRARTRVRMRCPPFIVAPGAATAPAVRLRTRQVNFIARVLAAPPAGVRNTAGPGWILNWHVLEIRGTFSPDS